MTKKEIVEYLVDNEGIARSTATKAVEGVMSCIGQAIASGDSVFLRGFGTLRVEVSKEKKARNIGTGEPVIVPPHRRVKFIPSAELKENMKL